MTDEFWKSFEDLPIVGILRGFDRAKTSAAARSAVDGGLRSVEVTMNTADAEQLIRELRSEFGEAVHVGAGTVLDRDACDRALSAGAQFIVTPVVAEDVIAHCREEAIPIFAGALTPTEIQRAWSLGASMVKVFPANRFGPGYVRDVKAPLDHVRLMPTGGVDIDTIADYHAAGADAFGVGSPLFKKERIDAEDWAWVASQTKRLIEAYRASG